VKGLRNKKYDKCMCMYMYMYVPVRTACVSACARGDPPPHGIMSSLFLASEMDRVGGRRTCVIGSRVKG
jgi:hypothetical protein